MHKASRAAAIGGVTAALAVIIMAMGTLIPVATFVCPMLCILLLQSVLQLCGGRAAWAWYGAVAILSLLFAPDKEAAAIFLFLGYYPILKPKFDNMPLSVFWKTLFFNIVVLAMYALLIHMFGMAEIASDYAELGIAMTAVTLLLGNITFFLMDRLLTLRLRRKR